MHKYAPSPWPRPVMYRQQLLFQACDFKGLIFKAISFDKPLLQSCWSNPLLLARLTTVVEIRLVVSAFSYTLGPSGTCC
ncbi:hypothetical protein DUNSADRAFT_13472 [Dunaliella salina]|uniref:Uncharacterized protein n=1 Tax=Dunaliella salina TaxID=3046 RepID=A0ABQ7G9B0_DUNSA|nr:hypothetical protein DUNSADRAFT_13472 [Dunaliella salina]|eukprot:KAF5831195.1 hypothetical protein DUNSADRAFT_13472 [Dunaliella salina]